MNVGKPLPSFLFQEIQTRCSILLNIISLRSDRLKTSSYLTIQALQPNHY